MKNQITATLALRFSAAMCFCFATFGGFAQIDDSLSADGLKRGVYTSFLEFRKNQPGIQEEFTAEPKPREHEKWTGTNDYKLRYLESGKRVKKAWGFSDGKNAYVFHQDEYFQIAVKDGQYTFVGTT